MAQVQAEAIQYKKGSSQDRQHRQLYLLETTELQLHMHICSLKHNTAFHLESYLLSPIYKKASRLKYLVD